jgi:TMEM175 potassium channel family protein
VGDRWDTGRTEAFSDGVFAIAITLLVLDIGVRRAEFDDLWGAIWHEWPGYFGYATSFLTIGGIWLAHHGIFRRLQLVSRPVMVLNLLLLMAVAFIPYPTRLVADAIRDEDAERAAVIFYGLSLLVVAILIAALWASVARDRGLLKPDVSDAEVSGVTRATTPNIGFYIAATVLAVVAPRGAAGLYLVIAAVALVRVRGDSRPVPRV